MITIFIIMKTVELADRQRTLNLLQNIFRQAKLGALHDALARAHPVDIASQGVDLAVVADHAHGLGAAPAGEGVGTEAGVDQGHVSLEVILLQVLVVCCHLQSNPGCSLHSAEEIET